MSTPKKQRLYLTSYIYRATAQYTQMSLQMNLAAQCLLNYVPLHVSAIRFGHLHTDTRLIDAYFCVERVHSNWTNQVLKYCIS